MIYLLTYEYSDKSAFKVCGVTETREVADAWFNASDETNVYKFHSLQLSPKGPQFAEKGWREEAPF